MRLRPETIQAQNEAIWSAAFRLKTFTYAQLSAEAHVSIERSTALIKGWLQARLAREAGLGDRRRKLFELTERAEPEALPANLIMPPTAPSAEEVMWRTMRMQKSFSPRDVAAISTTPEVTVSEDEAQRYIHVLMRGGYLRVVQPAKVTRTRGSLIKTHAMYRLIRNTGPVPPTERRVTGVWDGNTGEFAHLPGGEA